MGQKVQGPSWWDQEHDSAWQRVREAFRRDWEQTKHDLGGDAPDLKQDAGDTASQIAGRQPVPPRNQPTFETNEPAYRFGYGARRQYGNGYPEWDDQLAARLQTDWKATYPADDTRWEQYQNEVRRGWEFEGDTEKTRVV